MNRLYERTTKRRTASQLDAALRTEVTAHAEAHQLGDVLDAAASRRPRDERHRTVWSGAPEAASFYIGVSDDSAGHALLDELHAAVTRAKGS